MKSLPIQLPPPILTYLHHLVPLSIILSDKKSTGWFYNNYIQICVPPLEHNLPIDFYPEVHFSHLGNYFFRIYTINDDILDINKNNLIEYLIDKINKDYYICLFLSENLIPGTFLYQSSREMLHQQLIIGYNLEKRTFQIVNFNPKRILSIINVDFNSIKNAFFNKETLNLFKQQRTLCTNISYKGSKAEFSDCKYQIQLLKYNSLIPERYILNIEIIKNSLTDYLHSHNSSIQYSPFFEIGTEPIWGVSVIINLVNYLMNLQKEERIDYRIFHFVWEHKKIMYERIKLLNAEYDLKIDKTLIKDYGNIIMKCNQLRLLIIKQTMTNKNISQLISQMINIINEIYENETTLLTQLLSYL